MNCGTSSLPAGSIGDYSLTQLCGTIPPTALPKLEQWLEANSPQGQWIGKIYVASTISWTGTAFLQKGCSPNYMADCWTLTCCKHEMRSARPINQALSQSANAAVFIFTLSEQDYGGTQHLVSVAKVTRYFVDMNAYARYLLGSGNTALISSRLSRNRRNDGLLGWRFGDCHANRGGVVGPPHVDHSHGLNGAHCWAQDNTTGHTLLMSDCYLMWSKPRFSSIRALKQSRYGHNINPGNLRTLLK